MTLLKDRFVVITLLSSTILLQVSNDKVDVQQFLENIKQLIKARMLELKARKSKRKDKFKTLKQKIKIRKKLIEKLSNPFLLFRKPEHYIINVKGQKSKLKSAGQNSKVSDNNLTVDKSLTSSMFKEYIKSIPQLNNGINKASVMDFSKILKVLKKREPKKDKDVSADNSKSNDTLTKYNEDYIRFKEWFNFTTLKAVMFWQLVGTLQNVLQGEYCNIATNVGDLSYLMKKAISTDLWSDSVGTFSLSMRGLDNFYPVLINEKITGAQLCADRRMLYNFRIFWENPCKNILSLNDYGVCIWSTYTKYFIPTCADHLLNGVTLPNTDYTICSRFKEMVKKYYTSITKWYKKTERILREQILPIIVNNVKRNNEGETNIGYEEFLRLLIYKIRLEKELKVAMAIHNEKEKLAVVNKYCENTEFKELLNKIVMDTDIFVLSNENLERARKVNENYEKILKVIGNFESLTKFVQENIHDKNISICVASILPLYLSNGIEMGIRLQNKEEFILILANLFVKLLNLSEKIFGEYIQSKDVKKFKDAVFLVGFSRFYAIPFGTLVQYLYEKNKNKDKCPQLEGYSEITDIIQCMLGKNNDFVDCIPNLEAVKFIMNKVYIRVLLDITKRRNVEGLGEACSAIFCNIGEEKLIRYCYDLSSFRCDNHLYQTFNDNFLTVCIPGNCPKYIDEDIGYDDLGLGSIPVCTIPDFTKKAICKSTLSFVKYILNNNFKDENGKIPDTLKTIGPAKFAENYKKCCDLCSKDADFCSGIISNDSLILSQFQDSYTAERYFLILGNYVNKELIENYLSTRYIESCEKSK